MKEAAKSLASKSEIDNALYIADKNREKIKQLKTFDLSYLSGKIYSQKKALYLVLHQIIVLLRE